MLIKPGELRLENEKKVENLSHQAKLFVEWINIEYETINKVSFIKAVFEWNKGAELGHHLNLSDIDALERILL